MECAPFLCPLRETEKWGSLCGGGGGTHGGGWVGSRWDGRRGSNRRNFSKTLSGRGSELFPVINGGQLVVYNLCKVNCNQHTGPY